MVDDLERLRADAARYRWLRERLEVRNEEPADGGKRRPAIRVRIGRAFIDTKVRFRYTDEERSVELDAAIDGAMSNSSASGNAP